MIIENNIGQMIPAGYRVVLEKIGAGHYTYSLVEDKTKKYNRRNSQYNIDNDLKESI